MKCLIIIINLLMILSLRAFSKIDQKPSIKDRQATFRYYFEWGMDHNGAPNIPWAIKCAGDIQIAKFIKLSDQFPKPAPQHYCLTILGSNGEGIGAGNPVEGVSYISNQLDLFIVAQRIVDNKTSIFRKGDYKMIFSTSIKTKECLIKNKCNYKVVKKNKIRNIKLKQDRKRWLITFPTKELTVEASYGTDFKIEIFHKNELIYKSELFKQTWAFQSD